MAHSTRSGTRPRSDLAVRSAASDPASDSASGPAARSMPPGVRLFVGYALVIMAGVGLAMPRIIDDMTGAVPISLPGLVAMALLAFTIFTVTLVLQRKEAARALALALSSLTLPAVPLAWLSLNGFASRLPLTLFLAALAVLLFAGLTRDSAREYLSEA